MNMWGEAGSVAVGGGVCSEEKEAMPEQMCTLQRGTSLAHARPQLGGLHAGQLVRRPAGAA